MCFHLNGKIVTIIVLPQQIQCSHCAMYSSPGCKWIRDLLKRERDRVEVQSKPTAELQALSADISRDFDHTAEMTRAQSCLALLVVGPCTTSYACASTFNLAVNIVDISLQ